MSIKARFWRRGLTGAAAALPVGTTDAEADVQVTTHQVPGADGKNCSVTNHAVRNVATKAADGKRKEWLLVWAGDENIADTAVKDVKGLPGSRPAR